MREYRGFTYIGRTQLDWQEFKHGVDEWYSYCAQTGKDPDDDEAWETFSEWRNNRD